MFLSLGHKNRINAIANQYLPSIANRNAECAGLVFANKYLLNILRDLGKFCINRLSKCLSSRCAEKI